MIFKTIGAIGLLLISVGVVVKNKKRKNLLFIFGGVCLEIYSIYIKDSLFMTLQLIFILSAVYNLLRRKK